MCLCCDAVLTREVAFWQSVLTEEMSVAQLHSLCQECLGYSRFSTLSKTRLSNLSKHINQASSANKHELGIWRTDFNLQIKISLVYTVTMISRIPSMRCFAISLDLQILNFFYQFCTFLANSYFYVFYSYWHFNLP